MIHPKLLDCIKEMSTKYTDAFESGFLYGYLEFEYFGDVRHRIKKQKSLEDKP